MHTSVAVSETKPDSIQKVSNNKVDPNKEFKELGSLFQAEKANNAVLTNIKTQPESLRELETMSRPVFTSKLPVNTQIDSWKQKFNSPDLDDSLKHWQAVLDNSFTCSSKLFRSWKAGQLREFGHYCKFPYALITIHIADCSYRRPNLLWSRF